MSADWRMPMHREGLRVVLRILQEAIWSMRNSDEFVGPLTALTDGMQSLRIPYQHIGIYQVDEADASPTAHGQFLLRQGDWERALAGHDRDAALACWREGRLSYLENVPLDAPGLEATLEIRFGSSIKSLVEVPFANGVLAVASEHVAAFSGRDVEILRDLADALVPLFRRMEDLRKLEAAMQQVARAQRLELVGELAAGHAHEANNCLTIILGQCQLLLLDELDAVTRDSLERVLRATEAATGIMARQLDLARGREGEKTIIDVNELVSESLALVQRQFLKENVEIVDDLSPLLLRVRGNSGQLQQILINLVQNSHDALLVSGGGQMTIRTALQDQQILIEVVDNGPGIPEPLRERVFEPFFTTKGHGKGTGLGLSVCRSIAEAHAGQLYARRRAEGSCVVLELPASDQAALTAYN